jgi:hypothetical protein
MGFVRYNDCYRHVSALGLDEREENRKKWKKERKVRDLSIPTIELRIMVGLGESSSDSSSPVSPALCASVARLHSITSSRKSDSSSSTVS